MSIQNEVRNSWHDTIVELFELDLSDITGESLDVYYFTKDIFPDGRKLQWQGNTYEPFPIEITGFETTTKGSIPQPELTAANVLGTLASAVGAFDDLVGAKVTRRRTLGKYLDNGTSPNASEEFPPDIYYIERKTSESNLSITWQLASKIDLEGLQLPRRVVTQNYCVWKYRGSECGYTGPPVADERDQPLTGDGSQASQAYLSAIGTFSNARAAQRSAQYQLSAALSQVASDCDPSTRPFVLTYSSLATPYSFALVSSGQPLFGVVEGVAVDVIGADATHAPSRTVNTGFGANQNETGPVYELDSWVITDPMGTEPEFIESVFSLEPPVSFAFKPTSSDGAFFAIVSGLPVALVNEGEQGYRLGARRGENIAQVTAIALIDTSDSRCSEAQQALEEAEEDLETANAALLAATNALNAAAAALPTDSAVFQQDICGKRLNSCKLRFGASELPFGGFPGANLTR